MLVDPVALSLLSFAAVMLMMLAELRVSQRNERALVERGAFHPPDPVFGVMRVAYPAVFAAMALEGTLTGAPPGMATLIGVGIFAAGKLLKVWAIASLGVRWTYRVLVLPGAPLVTSGPYRFMRHPNYVGVAGELTGFALVTSAVWTGPLGTLFFLWLMWRRIVAEERALHLT